VRGKGTKVGEGCPTYFSATTFFQTTFENMSFEKKSFEKSRGTSLSTLYSYYEKTSPRSQGNPALVYVNSFFFSMVTKLDKDVIYYRFLIVIKSISLSMLFLLLSKRRKKEKIYS
jgi:hypothetical protein